MKYKNLPIMILSAGILISTSLIADEMNNNNMDHSNMDHAKHMMQMKNQGNMDHGENMMQDMNHGNMDHSKHMMQMMGNATAKPATTTSNSMGATPLKEPGNAIFGTIQEAIKALDADPNTDWSKVNIEALRQHLIDMENFTSGVDVLSQKNIEKGAEIVIRAKTKEAHYSLVRVLKAHPSMLKAETGWTMGVKQNKERFTLTIETQKPEEVARLRALGYIGVMALGNHHQIHHWMMAKGSNPHDGHMKH